LAIANLIDNAIRYSGGSRWIAVTAHQSGSSVVFEIRDRGVGIPPDEIDVIKHRFVRGRLAPAGGSGLGLGIVSRVAADHHGAFDLESEVGAGTTARLAIPIDKG
jgi:signal transduction histidine kinase